MSALGQKRTFACLSTFADRLRNCLFASIAHLCEMVLHAGFDAAGPRLNIRANLLDIRFTSLPDGSLLHENKLAA